MARETDPQSFLITGAQQPLDQQHRERVRKYLTLMAFRVPALVVAGIAYSITNNGYIALAIIIASVPLPWVAVLIANDRPPRDKNEVRHYKFNPSGPPELTGSQYRSVDAPTESSRE